ncbi:hypothetical protein, partial [Microcoleus anatoxicus]
WVRAPCLGQGDKLMVLGKKLNPRKLLLVNYSVMQVFVSSKGASATVSLPDLSMSFVFLFFGFPAGILDWLGDRHI